MFSGFLDRPTIGSSFDRRNNGLNLIRLMLAAAVVVAHWWPLGGYGERIQVGRSEPGAIAVDAFFVISGFLITSSRLTLGTGRFLWHRFLRIFPGFWLCLVLTAVLFAPLAWYHQHATMRGYPRASPHGPVAYVIGNSTLNMRAWDIAGTPARIPLPAVWDGSLWTLRWEFLCYLMIAVLGAAALLARRRIVLVLGVTMWAAYALHALKPAIAASLFAHQQTVARFVPLFLSGSLLLLYKDRIPSSRWLAAAAAVTVAVGYESTHPYLIVGPPLAYLCIWLASRIRMPRLLGRNDFSYGLYIYAMPVQQLLAVYGVPRWNAAAYLVLSLVGAMVFAAGSWFVVERRALGLKDYVPGRAGGRRSVRPLRSPLAPERWERATPGAISVGEDTAILFPRRLG